MFCEWKGERNYRKVIHTKRPLKENDEEDVKYNKILKVLKTQKSSRSNLGRGQSTSTNSHFQLTTMSEKHKHELIEASAWKNFGQISCALRNSRKFIISLCAHDGQKWWNWTSFSLLAFVVVFRFHTLIIHTGDDEWRRQWTEYEKMSLIKTSTFLAKRNTKKLMIRWFFFEDVLEKLWWANQSSEATTKHR